MNAFLTHRLAYLLLCATGGLFLFGCTHCLPYRTPPPLTSYHDTQQGIPIRRVAMLPLCYERENGTAAAEIDTSFHAELTKTTLFEVVWINRAQLETMVGRRQISSVEKIPVELLSALAAQYGADAVLFTDVTHYFPYQPISLGVRCKLVDIRTGEIRWAFDHLFDSGKPAIALDARHFYMANNQTNLPIGNDGNSVLQSPLRFASYAAWESYRSLLNKPPNPADLAPPCP
jgi:hypothetical protein